MLRALKKGTVVGRSSLPPGVDAVEDHHQSQPPTTTARPVAVARDFPAYDFAQH